jgi:WD40 repeat protein
MGDEAARQWSDGNGSAITTEGNGSGGSPRGPLSGVRRRQPRRRRDRRPAVIAATAVAILAAAGTLYALSPSGSSHATTPPPAATRPSKPVLAATLTVPDGGHVSAAWFSRDGKLMAGVGAQPRVYVWETSSPYHVTTLTVPPITFGNSTYLADAQSISFSADDTSLTMSLTAVNNDGSTLQGATPNFVYEWNLATGKFAVEGPVISKPGTAGGPGTVALFSGDNSRAVLANDGDGVIRPEALGPVTVREPLVKLPGTDPAPASGSLNDNGTELLYHAGPSLNDLWDFAEGKVVAQLRYQGSRAILSPNDAAVMEYPTLPKSSNVPELWDVATGSNVTPGDPRWNQQQGLLGLPAEFSTDGSVIGTFRANGKMDLWNVATRNHLATITETNFKVTGAITGPGGSEVAILGGDNSRQVSLWETPMSPPQA